MKATLKIKFKNIKKFLIRIFLFMVCPITRHYLKWANCIFILVKFYTYFDIKFVLHKLESNVHLTLYLIFKDKLSQVKKKKKNNNNSTTTFLEPH